MPVKLSTPAEDVDVTAEAFQPMLRNLQANILRPHGRDFARHVFIRFTAGAPEVKAWIRGNVAGRVTSAHTQYTTSAANPGGVVIGFFLAAKGYQHLGFQTNGFASGPFRRGMKDQRDGLIKEIFDTDNEVRNPNRWQASFQTDLHALVTFADDAEAVVEDEANRLATSLDGVGEVVTVEKGLNLRRTNALGKREPVEHFGYFDGISQPRFTQRDLDREAEVVPTRSDWNPSARLNLVLVDDPLTESVDAFGSYLVYRKLGQKVRVFEERITALAASLNVSPELAGAYVVGRFKDGTPVVKESAPQGKPENDFHFRSDEDGFRCPFHSHIRKANPRGTTPRTSLEDEMNRRIARRGVPYGAPFPGVADDDIPSDPDPDAPRGLLFMCFQADIARQFEFIQRTWVDNQHFPTNVFLIGAHDTGDDPLIGQDADEAQRWPKEWGKKNGGKKTFNFESAVTLEGGEYFFAPSLQFMESL